MKNIKAALQKTFSFAKDKDRRDEDTSSSQSDGSARFDRTRALTHSVSFSSPNDRNSEQKRSYEAAQQPRQQSGVVASPSHNGNGHHHQQHHAPPPPVRAFESPQQQQQQQHHQPYPPSQPMYSNGMHMGNGTAPVAHVPPPAAPVQAMTYAAAPLPASMAVQHQQQHQQQPQQHSQPAPQQKPAVYQSVTIAVAEHCPFSLFREKWSLEDFELKKQMYAGQISLVYHAVDKRSGISVALKLYRRAKLNEMERHQVAREIKLHIELNHSSIIALYAAWKDRNYVYLALEWAPGGDVYTFLKAQGGRLTEDVAVPLVLEPFLSAIKYIHDLGLIHRDIKPENILLNSSFQIKIADFGLSIDSRNEIANTRLGTIDYLAPEILDCPVKSHPMDNKDKPHIGYTNKVDCWSVGVLAYEVLVGRPPFEAMNAHETLKRIKYKKVEYPADLSPGAVDFMKHALVRDPEQRGSIELLLNHPWIRAFAKKRENLAKRNHARRSRTFGQSTVAAPGAHSADLLLVDSPSLPPLLRSYEDAAGRPQQPQPLPPQPLPLQQHAHAMQQQQQQQQQQQMSMSNDGSRPLSAAMGAQQMGMQAMQPAAVGFASPQHARAFTPHAMGGGMTYSHSANNIRALDPAERYQPQPLQPLQPQQPLQQQQQPLQPQPPQQPLHPQQQQQHAHAQQQHYNAMSKSSPLFPAIPGAQPLPGYAAMPRTMG